MTTKEEREHETTVKGMIRVSGRDVWVVDRSLFPTRGPVGQKLKFLLRYGILAPSYFNLQPWKFLVKNDTIFFYADLDRALPITDPHNRALYLSCGCVLNYLNLAARHYGYEGNVKLFPPDPTGELIATFDLGPGEHEISAKEEILFQAVARSHTSWEAFEVPTDLLVQFESEMDLFREKNVWLEMYPTLKYRKKICRIVSTALEVLQIDRESSKEVSALLAKRDRGMTGGEEALALARPHTDGLDTFDMHRKSVKMPAELAEHSPLIAVIGTRSDHKEDVVLCGIAMSRILLVAAAHGVSHSYLNHPVVFQKLRGRVAAVVEGVDDIEDEREVAAHTQNVFPQTILRFGFGVPVKHPTPRRSVKSMIIKEPPTYRKP